MTAFDGSAVNSVTTKTVMKLKDLLTAVVICVNVKCEPVIILNGDISFLCMGLTAEIGNIHRKSLRIFVFSVEVLKSNGKVPGNSHNKSVSTLFISTHTVMHDLSFFKKNKILK